MGEAWEQAVQQPQVGAASAQTGMGFRGGVLVERRWRRIAAKLAFCKLWKRYDSRRMFKEVGGTLLDGSQQRLGLGKLLSVAVTLLEEKRRSLFARKLLCVSSDTRSSVLQVRVR